MNTSNTSLDPYDDDLPLGPIVGIILVQAVGTVVGNLMVCIAIYIQPSLHHVTYHSIFSLALADLLAGLVAMPSYVAKKFVTEGPFYQFVCDAFRFSYFLTGYASILSLCVISVERLLAVKCPLTYMMTVTHARVVIALVVIWIDSVLVSVLPFLPLSSGVPRECNYHPTSWWSVMVIITNVIIPFLFIVTCYVYIYLIARAHLAQISRERASVRETLQMTEKRTNERRERKANITIMIVIGLFVVCWFPSSFYYFLQKVCPWCFPESFAGSRGFVNAFVKILTFTSSFCNPIIYCWRINDFRKAFIKILLRKTRNFAESFRSRSRTSTSQSESLNEKNSKGLSKGKRRNTNGVERSHFKEGAMGSLIDSKVRNDCNNKTGSLKKATGEMINGTSGRVLKKSERICQARSESKSDSESLLSDDQDSQGIVGKNTDIAEMNWGSCVERDCLNQSEIEVSGEHTDKEVDDNFCHIRMEENESEIDTLDGGRNNPIYNDRDLPTKAGDFGGQCDHTDEPSRDIDKFVAKNHDLSHMEGTETLDEVAVQQVNTTQVNGNDDREIFEDEVSPSNKLEISLNETGFMEGI